MAHKCTHEEAKDFYRDNLQLLAERIGELADVMRIYKYDKNFDIVFYLDLAHSKTVQQIDSLPNS